MAIHKPIAPYKLTRTQRKALLDHLEGRVAFIETSRRLGVTKQRLYTMLAVIFRHAAGTGKIDAATLLKDY